MNLVSLLFGFKGRINRAQFWLGNLAAGLGAITLMLVLGAMLMPTGAIPKTGAGAMQIVSVVAIVLGAPLLLVGWIGSALQTKRFHDRGKSALWTMLPLIPGFMVASTLVASLAGGEPPEQAISSVGTWLLIMQAVNIFLIVDLGCLPGKDQPNQYGPPPGGGLSAVPTQRGPLPGQSVTNKVAAPTPGTGLASAESAIERAIAAREKQSQSPVQQMPARSTLSAQPVPLRAATAGSFGRKASS